MKRRSFIQNGSILATGAIIVPSSYTSQSSAHLMKANIKESEEEVVSLRESSPTKVQNILNTFNFNEVSIGKSRWQRQLDSALSFYLSVDNDDILHGFRKDAGMNAPGKPLGGWCSKKSDPVFGQWLSGMARIFQATNKSEFRKKATELMTEWAKTIGPDGNCRMSHYAFDKIICGLVDMKKYAGQKEAISILDKVTDWAIKNLNRDRIPASPSLGSGKPGEWYTLSENLYRAYELTGDPKYKSFAEVWHYPQYWDKFENETTPDNAFGVHAYSHVNTFSSAAMAYSVTGDPKYLQIIRNFYEFMQKTQCYATGGYGSTEHLMPANGSLGRSLEYRSNSFETSCGSWAGFKLSRYLMQFTGEAQYGDWIESLLYNGIGAALPICSGGKNFYYSDYRVSSGMKVYYWHPFTCCSGTYIQNLAEYHRLIYFKDTESIYINLYLPSQVTWKHKDSEVKIIQETSYPEEEYSRLKLMLNGGRRFAIKFRIPSWALGASIRVNGINHSVSCQPGSWACIDQEWRSGDIVDIHLPMYFRISPIDVQHSKRVAIVYGPLAMVMDAHHNNSWPALPYDEEELNQVLVPTETPAVFSLRPKDGTRPTPKFYPFYMAEEIVPYCMYHDLDKRPIGRWKN